MPIVNNKFRERTLEIRRQVQRETLNAAEDAAVIARARCPVSEGEHKDGSPHMRDTIGIETGPNGMVRLVVRSPYAALVVYGFYSPSGSFIPPDDFIHPAIDAVLPKLEKSLTKIL